MRKIVYYVASSLDGYIAGSQHEIDRFVGEGDGVQQYLQDLQDFDTVLMGRTTYEFGYQFGLQPGKPAYPHMEHYIFSESLTFEEADEKVKVVPLEIEQVKTLKTGNGTDIYLCGGGQFAGWLLEHELIDVLKLKLNPIVLGTGIPLFGESKKPFSADLVASQKYDGGLLILTYQLKY